ncbi:MAG TPA: CoA transferase [Dehalococcoidia bacterium]|jgi:crotonobetainyl-CoA:carnitine CoA-transferase CaiB-like acyl-CoA transferase|nr:CoA transferase [Dehalococcoidia bacterium]|tara:strand:+ start:895 stop:2253 length:1359 start_codon:yes stop_codon:yes gene_type:complete
MTDLPLNGIRVVDLSRVFAMPYAGAYLADLGAEVIKVDCCQAQFVDTTRTLNGPYPDNDPGELYWERAGTFQTLNRGKRSITLDLRSGDAIGILKQLVSVSDIVLENFTPRVMQRFGLDYANLRAVKPDLIMVSNTGYGHSGPWSNFGAMATALEPTHGTGAFMGYLDPGPDGRLHDGGIPNKMGNSYTDFLASWTAQLAVIASLIHRSRTGKGMWVDLAMYQVGSSFIGEGILDFAFNGRRTRRMGNRDHTMSPHGCYPCLGQDEWVTIAVRDDRDWEACCQALGQPSLAGDSRFAHPTDRHGHQDELDEIISRWTSTQSQYQIMEALQSAGVPAGPVLNAKALLADPQYRARGFFQPADHADETGLGRKEYVGRGWSLSESLINPIRPAPMLGEANDYVLSRMLCLNDEEIQRLKDAGTVGDTLADARAPSIVPLERQVELGWISGYDEL